MRHGRSFIFAIVLLCANAFAEEIKILNVSYDPTRELYEELNRDFAAEWEKSSGNRIEITQSHGGSGKQARSVIDGLEADVVTLALAYDIDKIAEAKLLPPNWQSRLPHNSSPYTSTIVFLVRKGNPRQIHDWSDLVKPDVQVITPNPKTSGGARWNYLAAWGYAQRTYHDEGKANEFMKKLLANVPVLDSGARASTMTFLKRGMGDVLIAWENEAMLAARTFAKDEVELVVPSISIRAEPPVAVIDAFASKHGTVEVAQAYLRHLYAPSAQGILEKHFFRPSGDVPGDAARGEFPRIDMLTIDSDFGGWSAAHTKHFADGGTFDQVYGME